MVRFTPTIYPPRTCTTPLGLAVVPEVYRMNNGSSAFMTSVGTATVSSLVTSCHQTSRPSFMVMASPVFFTTMTFSIDGQSSDSALLTMSYNFINLPRRIDPSTVTKILDSASLILSRKAKAENPAYTTVCITPILAQVSMVIAVSGILGM